VSQQLLETDATRPYLVIMAELKQTLDKRVCHGVHTQDFSKKQRSAINRNSMFLKDKYLASGAFERLKARLVAEGNRQDKRLNEELSSQTVATLSVLAIAAIARSLRSILGVHSSTQT
jgi:alpha-acetolactate decarboxylase